MQQVNTLSSEKADLIAKIKIWHEALYSQTYCPLILDQMKEVIKEYEKQN
jgi:hypothetical protein